MKKRKISEKKHTEAASFGKALAVGIGTGLAVWVLLLLAVSSLIVGREDPDSFIVPAVFVLAAAASVSAGIAVSHIFKGNIPMSGLVTGAVLLAIVWAMSLACAGTNSMDSMPLKILLCADFIVFSLLGAKLGISQHKAKRHRK